MGIGVQHGLEGAQKCDPLGFTWGATSYNAGGLKTCVPIFQPAADEVFARLKIQTGKWLV